MKKAVKLYSLLLSVVIILLTICVPVYAKDNVQYSFSELSSNDVISLYNKAVSNAKESKPSYVYKYEYMNNSTELNLKDPLKLINLFGKISDQEIDEEISKIIEEEKAEDEILNTVVSSSTQKSADYLPKVINFIDLIKYKSVKYEFLNNGNLRMYLSFSDERNPSTDSLISKAFYIEDYDTELDYIKSEMEVSGIRVKSYNVTYQNAEIICEIDPDSLEICNLEMNIEKTSEMSFLLFSVLRITGTFNDSYSYTYSNFDYKTRHMHSYSEREVLLPTCTESGCTKYICSCGDEYTLKQTEAMGHQFSDWIITENSDYLREGTECRSCSVCGKTEMRAIPVKESEDGVKTVLMSDEMTINYKNNYRFIPEMTIKDTEIISETWSSSDKSVATVDETGVVHSKNTGSTVISCEVTDIYGNTFSTSSNVTVEMTWWQWIIKIVFFGWIWY